MKILMVVDTLVALLVRLCELIGEWRANRGEGHIEGVGRVADRVDAIVARHDARDDLANLPKAEANKIRRRDALEEMELVGIRLKERDRRLLLEASLVRADLNKQA